MSGEVARLLRDVVLTKDEVYGLMAGLLTSDTVPIGATKREDRLKDNLQVQEGWNVSEVGGITARHF